VNDSVADWTLQWAVNDCCWQDTTVSCEWQCCWLETTVSCEWLLLTGHYSELWMTVLLTWHYSELWMTVLLTGHYSELWMTVLLTGHHVRDKTNVHPVRIVTIWLWVLMNGAWLCRLFCILYVGTCMLKAKREEKKEADSHPSLISFSFYGHCVCQTVFMTLVESQNRVCGLDSIWEKWDEPWYTDMSGYNITLEVLWHVQEYQKIRQDDSNTLCR